MVDFQFGVRCTVCAGTNVEISLPCWIDCNTEEVTSVDWEASTRETWCNDCQDHHPLFNFTFGCAA